MKKMKPNLFSQDKIINNTGKEAIIYLIDGVVYKYYRNRFMYDESKMRWFERLLIPDIITPREAFSVGNTPQGFNMNYVEGSVLRTLTYYGLQDILAAARMLPNTIRNMSSEHMTPSDINIDSILLNKNTKSFTLVDTYGYLFAEKIKVEHLYNHNIKRINDTVCCGLFGHDWRLDLKKYFSRRDLHHLPGFNISHDYFVYDILSFLGEREEETTLQEIREKVKRKTYNIL